MPVKLQFSRTFPPFFRFNLKKEVIRLVSVTFVPVHIFCSGDFSRQATKQNTRKLGG
ncbi:MAG: hypothetical protein ACJAYJ_001906 [Saprospiraceae bacterium]|jgi:hypothetical protein